MPGCSPTNLDLLGELYGIPLNEKLENPGNIQGLQKLVPDFRHILMMDEEVIYRLRVPHAHGAPEGG